MTSPSAPDRWTELANQLASVKDADLDDLETMAACACACARELAEAVFGLIVEVRRRRLNERIDNAMKETP